MERQFSTVKDSHEDLRDILIDLLSRTALHDRQAFSQLYSHTSANLYQLVRRILIKEEWAQDCLQEAYIKIWNSAESYLPGRAAPMTWMMTIARNQALDLLRKQRREVGLDGIAALRELESDDPHPLQNLLIHSESQRLGECMDELNPQSRQTIALAYMRGLTHEELANQMAIPLGTVKTWIRRGLQQLKRCLES